LRECGSVPREKSRDAVDTKFHTIFLFNFDKLFSSAPYIYRPNWG
jgi:hypothetical protein